MQHEHKLRRRAAAYGVHFFTASGIIPAALAVREIASPNCDPRVVFSWLLLATLIDAFDGPLARKFHVKRFAPNIDGRTIDDLIDYLTFAFVPLLLIWRMEWLPAGTGWTVMLAMAASLLGFAHVHAKDEERGFFRGFPSYWNAFALYAGVFSSVYSPWLTAFSMWCLTVLTVMPVWMIYPNLAPRSWRVWILGGAAFWTLTMIAILWQYPRPSTELLLISLAYPAFYTYASWYCRRSGRTQPESV